MPLTPQQIAQMRANSVGKITENSDRNVWDAIRRKYGKNYICTQGSLRLERNLSGALNNVQFDLLENVNKNSGVTFPTELRLAQSDKFIVTSMGFFMATYDPGAGTPETRSSAVLHTFPNANVFNGANEAKALQQLYAGILKIQIGTTNYVQQLRMMEFYRSPLLQQGTALSTVAGTGVALRDSMESGKYGYIKYTPTITLAGIASYNIGVQIQESPLMAVTPSGTRVDFVALCFDGIYLAKKVKIWGCIC